MTGQALSQIEAIVASMGPVALALAFAGLFGAGLVKGATGIGFATCALPIVAAAVGLKPAMALVILPTLAVNAGLALSGGRLNTALRNHGVLYAAMLPGVAAGVSILAAIDQRNATAGLGLVMVAYAAFALLRPALRFSPKAASVLRLPAGLATGFVTGLTGSQVMPLVPYLLAAEEEPRDAIGAINVGVLLLSVMLAAGLIATSAVDPVWFAASMVGVFPAAAGATLGASIQSRLSNPLLRVLVLLVIGAMGIKMLAF